MIKILAQKCTACGQCIKACPQNCIAIVEKSGRKTAEIDVSKCNYCKICQEICSKLREKSADKNIFNAVEIAQAKSKQADISKYKGVWCFAEVLHGNLSPVIFELLYIGKKLSRDLNEPLCAVIMGDNVSRYAQELISHGAEIVYAVDSPKLANFVDDIYAKCLADLILQYKPNKFILPATTIGRSLAAKTAVLASAGLTADATGLVIDKSTALMQVTRPTFGGNLMATIVCQNRRPEMCSLRPLTYPKATADSTRKSRVINFPFDEDKYSSQVKFINFVQEEAGKTDIGSAETIVSGGRGLNNPDGFKLLHELAKLLNGAVGASRAAVDSGWIAYRHQVGLTGRTVKPKLYIACGISGQVQHLAGMSSSDVIVAINKDPQAPLMQQASYAVEADLYEIVPAIIEELKSQKS
ncbi:MAG: electron transfer flavoprotein subunit alpha [Elusimicrobia bacterium]|nr:electron transfer flavoprotein subunit alpha [Elusimicrobiota bacterium]